MGFSRQEYWSGLSCPPSADFPNLGIEPMSLKSIALASRLFTTSATWEASLKRREMINFGMNVEKRAFVHYWWNCKLVQLLWKIVWEFRKKVTIELP